MRCSARDLASLLVLLGSIGCSSPVGPGAMNVLITAEDATADVIDLPDRQVVRVTIPVTIRNTGLTSIFYDHNICGLQYIARGEGGDENVVFSQGCAFVLTPVGQMLKLAPGAKHETRMDISARIRNPAAPSVEDSWFSSVAGDYRLRLHLYDASGLWLPEELRTSEPFRIDVH